MNLHYASVSALLHLNNEFLENNIPMVVLFLLYVQLLVKHADSFLV